ncbi:MAG TPA: hypothetical protein VGG64_25975 [Pirellulales bacterium]|jgi:hypothetical protein
MSDSFQVRASAPDSSGAFVLAPGGTRVDMAHALWSAPPTTAAPNEPLTPRALASGEASVVPASDLLARLRSQGRQLARLLHERQQDLDRREAQQNAQAAELDGQLRAARLWLTERHQELSEREAASKEHERQLAVRARELNALAAADDAARTKEESALHKRSEELSLRQAALDRLNERLTRQAKAQQTAQRELELLREREHNVRTRARQQLDNDRSTNLDTIRQALAHLERRRAAIEIAAEATERRRAQLASQAQRPSPEQKQRARELTEIAEGLARREQHLTQAEQLQLRAETELAAMRHELEQERHELAEQARIERRRLADSQRATAAETAEKRELLQRRNEQLDQRQASLERMRDELVQLQRESLEARLVAEETLAALTGVAAPAAVASALAQSRERLADHWRLTTGRIADERAALARLGQEVTAQSKSLAAKKEDLGQWAQRRQQEFDLQAAALAQREEAMSALQNQVGQERAEWEQGRLTFEQELRTRMARLRKSAD